jgi:nicotinamide riboside transporter PnuC
MITALSIMVAAVFVRLNRGMPTLEWKSVDPQQRKELTSQVVALSKEYGWIIAINAVVLLGLVVLSVVGKAEVAECWPLWMQRLTATAIGGAGALCVARMTYVVWRDIDVVRLQKQLIDGTASRELTEHQGKLADDKVTSIRAAGVRKIEVPPPRSWGE